MKSQALYLYIFINVGDMLVVIKWWVKFVCLISGGGGRVNQMGGLISNQFSIFTIDKFHY